MQRKVRRLRCLALVLIVAVTISILPTGLLAPAAAAAVTTAAGEPVGDFVRGDVTGDGVVDGRDALQIMRILEGYEPATAETTARGDVHPVPGTDGRLIGNGVLTAEDARKILRGSVGLVSSGEISGDFAGSLPRITGFEPASGPVGTRVTILLSSDREAGMEIYSMGQDGAGVSRLTTSLGENTQPHAGTFSTAASASFTAASFWAASTVSGEEVRVVVESKTARPGETVTVSVDLEGAQDLGHLAFDLGYDRNKLTLFSLEPGEFTTSGLVAINPENLTSAAGQVRFNWVRAAGFTGNDWIMTFTFKVAPDAPSGDLALILSGLAATLSAAGVAMAEAPATGQDGAILVAPAFSADLDGNGVVDLADLAQVTSAYGAMSGSELWNEYLDLAPDGVIDLYDLVLVARRLQPR